MAHLFHGWFHRGFQGHTEATASTLGPLSCMRFGTSIVQFQSTFFGFGSGHFAWTLARAFAQAKRLGPSASRLIPHALADNITWDPGSEFSGNVSTLMPCFIRIFMVQHRRATFLLRDHFRHVSAGTLSSAFQRYLAARKTQQGRSPEFYFLAYTLTQPQFRG